MKKMAFSVFLMFLYFCFLMPKGAPAGEGVQPSNYALTDLIPVDPSVEKGVFENGVHYYIKTNKKPEKRATLWLAVNAGSVLENDDQQGLAHFSEHMGFNGTKNFQKQELVDFLESIGMRFGPEINAYTSFDETVYFINVPTDSACFMEKGFQILEDWAHQMSFDGVEIDKERGVIVEEWRLGRGANGRMRDKQLPILFKNSRYAERLPIGKKEIVEECTYETLRQFYKDWYRPDLQAIVAVGEFDKEKVLNLMKKHFAAIPTKEYPRERTIFPVPDHDEVLFAIATDPEADRTQISVYFKSEAKLTRTVGDYKESLMEQAFNTMLNNRLNELTKKAEPPFLYGYSAKVRFVRSKGVFFLGAGVKEGGAERGLNTLFTEAFRVQKFGFTESEFKRTKIELMRNAERAYKEQDKTESNNFAQEYVYNFLDDEPMPNAEQELALTKQLLPTIQLAEVNDLVSQWITDKNRVIMLSAPQKESAPVPTEEQLLAVFKSVERQEIQPYQDTVSDEPLVANPPKPAKIIKEKKWKELGVTEWTLANGVHVVLKPTDFKNDEILFTAYSFGGNSLVPQKDFTSAVRAGDIVYEGGLGTFSNIDLQKKLTGKVVSVWPGMDMTTERMSGNASPDDIETLFQLIYLYMTSPRTDTTAFKSYLSRMKGQIENRSARPEVAFSDTISVTLAQHHFRSRPWTVERLKEINYQTALKIYKERFADASDFHFFFVGNFDPEKIKPLVQSYLGGLPSLNRKETWKDPQVNRPAGVVQRKVEKGIEPKSRVYLSFGGSYDWGVKSWHTLYSLQSVMNIKLREILREDMGGTYGVSVGHSIEKYPKSKYTLNINFGCSPDRVDEMVKTIFLQIDSLKMAGPKESYISKVKEIQTRSYETDLKENNFWLHELEAKHIFSEDWMDIFRYPDFVKELSTQKIQQAAQKYLDTKNYVQVVLLPEAKAENPEPPKKE